MKRIELVLMDATTQALSRVFFGATRALKRGMMTGVIADVEGRIGEDKETELDKWAMSQIVKTYDEFREPVFIVGESGNFGDESAEFMVVVDPFDGSTPARLGWVSDSIFYSSIAVFDAQNKPIIGAVLDIKEGMLYTAFNGLLNARVLSVRGDMVCKSRNMPLVARRPQAIAEVNPATYRLKEKYDVWTRERALSLIQYCDAAGKLFHPNAGSFMAAVMLAGKDNIGLYFLGGELLSETVTFMPFIEMGGMGAVVVYEDGRVRPFKPNVTAIREDPSVNYREASRMNLFILGITPEIVDEAVQVLRGEAG